MNPTPIDETAVAKQPDEALAEVVEIPASEGQPKGYPLPPKKPPASLVSASASKYEHFEGPMPPPQLLAHYESICPGSADRMLKMAEQEADHRRKTETTIVDAQIQYNNKQFAEARCGQMCALVITLAAIAGGV